MYGSWFGAIMGGAFVLLLAVAAMLTAWPPIFAFAIVAAIGAVMLVLAAMRRTAEGVPGREVHAGDPESHAAPVGGEGSSGSDGNVPEAPQPERAPEPESAGIWGERG